MRIESRGSSVEIIPTSQSNKFLVRFSGTGFSSEAVVDFENWDLPRFLRMLSNADHSKAMRQLDPLGGLTIRAFRDSESSFHLAFFLLSQEGWTATVSFDHLDDKKLAQLADEAAKLFNNNDTGGA